MKSDKKYYVCDDVKKVRTLYADIISDLEAYQSTFEFINAMSISQYRQYAIGHPMSIIELKSWHPDCISNDYQYIMDLGLSIDDIQLCQARQFGYTSWDDVILQDQPIDHQFEKAVDYLLEGDLDQLRLILKAYPDLVERHSSFAHRATLIHYIAANGVETHRQIVPHNIVAITTHLLDHGANPNAQHNIYQGNGSLIDLIQTSAHPNEAGIAKSLIDLLT